MKNYPLKYFKPKNENVKNKSSYNYFLEQGKSKNVDINKLLNRVKESKKIEVKKNLILLSIVSLVLSVGGFIAIF